ETYPSIHGGDPCAVRRWGATRQPHEESSHRRGQARVVARRRQSGTEPLQQCLVLQLIASDARECGTHLALQVAGARDLVEREGGRFLPAEEHRQELRECLGVRRAETKARAGAIVGGEFVVAKNTPAR